MAITTFNQAAGIKAFDKPAKQAATGTYMSLSNILGGIFTAIETIKGTATGGIGANADSNKKKLIATKPN